MISLIVRVKDEEKRESIKKETFAMVEEQGLAGLKMGHLAKRVGVSPSTLYVYFKDKEDLVTTLFREVTQSIVGRLMGSFQLGTSFEENMRGAWYSYMDYLYENYPAIAFHEQVKTSPYFAELADQFKDVDMAGPLEVIRLGIQLKEIKDMDENLLLTSLGAMSIRMTQMFIKGHLERNEKNMEDCFRLTYDSLKA